VGLDGIGVDWRRPTSLYSQLGVVDFPRRVEGGAIGPRADGRLRMDESNAKELELAKRGVDAFIDRANELHHQGRYADALKQLEVRRTVIEWIPSRLHSVLGGYAKKN